MATTDQVYVRNPTVTPAVPPQRELETVLPKSDSVAPPTKPAKPRCAHEGAETSVKPRTKTMVLFISIPILSILMPEVRQAH
jgi:hypothetical protein